MSSYKILRASNKARLSTVSLKFVELEHCLKVRVGRAAACSHARYADGSNRFILSTVALSHDISGSKDPPDPTKSQCDGALTRESGRESDATLCSSVLDFLIFAASYRSNIPQKFYDTRTETIVSCPSKPLKCLPIIVNISFLGLTPPSSTFTRAQPARACLNDPMSQEWPHP